MMHGNGKIPPNKSPEMNGFRTAKGSPPKLEEIRFPDLMAMRSDSPF